MVVGVRANNLQFFEDEICWGIPPYFRKPAKKKRSQSRHLVPVVGFAAKAAKAAKAARALWSASADADAAWLMPAIKVRKRGVAPKTPYMTPRTLSRVFEMMPGVDLSGHEFDMRWPRMVLRISAGTATTRL
jgi:hypothetical protein